MAGHDGVEEEYKMEPGAIIDDDDDEKASLKASPDHKKKSEGKSNDNNIDMLDPKSFPTPSSKKHSDIQSQSNQPSLTRRMSSQFVFQVERQKSVVDNIGLTEKVNQYVPDAITQHIPGLNRKASQLKLTYFCNICFTKRAIDEGFTLRRCQHQFCPECIKGFMDNKINNGVVNLSCFYPMDDKSCGETIDEEDVHQIVSAETWDKYEKFKANIENTYSRQCPWCDYTQIGNPEHPMMICENEECEKQFCLEHSNAHSADISCDQYELSMAKETKMNEMVLKEMGDNVKPCPQCKFHIIKSGGCNHMNCVKCGCSFCWLCMEVIENEELPQHYKDPNSPCKGQQFAGMEGEPPPRWILCLLVICMAIFCIPSTVLGIVFGCICFPLVMCCDCRNDNGERQGLWDTMFGCWLIWLIIFVVIAVFVPLIVFYIIWEVIKAIYGIIRICIPCLPRCPAGGGNRNQQQQQQPGGGNQSLLNENNNNNPDNVVRNNDIAITVS